MRRDPCPPPRVFEARSAPQISARKGPAQVVWQVFVYGVKVSFWGSGTLKTVIYVENYPQKRSFVLADYHPLWVGGC